MKKALRTRVAGVGTALGAVLVSSVFGIGCQPGTLPCDQDDDWRKVCSGEPGTSLANNGGSTGSTGSGGSAPSGSGGGGSAMGGNGGANSDPVAEKEIAGCTMWPKVKDMDKFFASRCSDGAACHNLAAFGDFKAPEIWKRLANAPAKLACVSQNTMLIDTKDYAKSLVWIRTQQDGKCSDGKSSGARMPAVPMAPLTDSETACLKGYLQALQK
jgi:hypothetical protein